jgi:integrase
LLAIETAMRRGELLALTWENIHLDRRIAFLPDTKNGDSRTVPLSTTAINLLRQLPRSVVGPVFPITANALKLCFRRACIRAGIEDLHFHDLRHEATSRLAEKLTNILELSAVTGHKDLRMLKRYYHPRAEELALKLG